MNNLNNDVCNFDDISFYANYVVPANVIADRVIRFRDRFRRRHARGCPSLRLNKDKADLLFYADMVPGTIQSLFDKRVYKYAGVRICT